MKNQVVEATRDFMQALRECKHARKDYCIKPAFTCSVTYQIMFILPSIVYVPWIYRYNNQYVIEVDWLVFHIGLLKWNEKEKTDGKTPD